MVIGMPPITSLVFDNTYAYLPPDLYEVVDPTPLPDPGLIALNPDAAHPLLGISIDRLEIDDVEPLRAEITAFLDSIANGSEPPVTGADGRRALALAVGVLEKIDAHASRVFAK